MTALSPTLRLLLALLLLAPALGAQEVTPPPRERSLPFSVWIDLQKRTQKRADWPVWMESVEIHDEIDQEMRTIGRTIRLRFRRFSSLNLFLLARLQFLDEPEAAPVLTAWSEGGDCSFDSAELGGGTGLNRMERLILPMRGVDYLEIQVPGTGANLRSIHLVSMGEATVMTPLDFVDRVPLALDPFASASENEVPGRADEALLGRVSASLLDREVLLRPQEGGGALEFELEGPPLLAVLRLKVLNVEPAQPPRVAINNTPLGPLSLRVPDLADPAFRGGMSSLSKGVTIRYSGWMAAEVVIPGGFLRAGINRIDLQLLPSDQPLVIREVELQLKYNDPSFDYDLSPLLNR